MFDIFIRVEFIRLAPVWAYSQSFSFLDNPVVVSGLVRSDFLRVYPWDVVSRLFFGDVVNLIEIALSDLTLG